MKLLIQVFQHFSQNGSLFLIGSFLNDKKNGKGTHITKHHKYLEEWKEGKLIERKSESSGPNETSEVDTSIIRLEKLDKSPITPVFSQSII